MRRKYRNSSGIGIISLVVLILCGIIAYKHIDLQAQKEKAELKIKRLETQIKEQEERATEINNMAAYVQTKRYIEDIARQKLGLVYEDEILFKAEE